MSKTHTFDWAAELAASTQPVVLRATEAREIAAELQQLRTGYEAARLEIESLHAQLESIGAGGVEPLRKSAQAAPAAGVTAGAVPDGWKLVPVEPTPEMLRAGDQKTWVLPSLDCWRAMLAAAPQPPADQKEGEA